MPQTREEQPRDKGAALGQGPGYSSSDTHNNSFELVWKSNHPPPTNARYQLLDEGKNPSGIKNMPEKVS